jgi:hypothetical protein
MGRGAFPGPIDDLGPEILIDDGTLARTDSPLPGPVGVQAKGGAGKSSVPIGEQVVNYARGKLGERVGRGECFDLADRALRNAGAKSAADFGSVADDADYVWGTAVSLSDVRPGDIIQFRDYRYDRTVETSTREDTDFQTRPHHTAIVERVDGGGALTVLEQNAPEGDPGKRTQLFFSDVSTSSGGKKTTVKVQGTFRFYRPQPR